MQGDTGIQREYDYIIVGGGSAGCVLACRLSEDRSMQVLLVERGTSYSRLTLGVPLIGMRNMTSHLQVFYTRQQLHCRNRKVCFPVANAMGGGSSVNAMLYVRGERRAYNGWAEHGAQGWGYDDLLPYFRRMENYECGQTRYHGSGGPIGVSGTRYKSTFGRAFIEACVEKGLSRNDDFTGADQQGVGFYQYTQLNGERSSAALGYLRPAESRKNLHVLPWTEVDKIILSGARAVGVVCRRSQGEFKVYAGREVILSAGAIGSPKILMLSGIGSADALRSIGIDPRCDIPGVGKGLQDHPSCPVLYLPRKPVSLSFPALVLPFFRWCLSGDGIFTSTTIAAGAFVQLSNEGELADCQFSSKWAGSPPYRGTVDFQPSVIDVESRGSVQLVSADPKDDPIVDPNYLSTRREVQIMTKAIRFARALTRTKSFEEFGLVKELLPGPDVQSDKELEDYVRSSVGTSYHPAGTCRMGSGQHSVVDSNLRVHGLEHLRIVDASIMPRLINGNTNGPTIMIAEKAADLIREG